MEMLGTILGIFVCPGTLCTIVLAAVILGARSDRMREEVIERMKQKRERDEDDNNQV